MSEIETLDTDLNKNDRTNDNRTVLRKKIKLEHDFILSKAKKSTKALI